MIKDFFVSFGDNFKEKTKNPLLGTYLIVWMFRNWELVFTLFNFDNDQKLKDKIAFINDYYTKNDFVENLWNNVYWSFGLLVITYLLINLSRFIVNLSEKQLTPWIYKLTDSKSIVLKTVYERVRAEKEDLQIRLDQERDSKSRLENRIKNLELEIAELTKPAIEDNISNNDGNLPNKTNLETTPIIMQKLKEKELLQEFINTAVKINKGESIENNYTSKDYFIELGLLKFTSNGYKNTKNYQITSEGENLLKKARLE